jgi:hypothetical protein
VAGLAHIRPRWTIHRRRSAAARPAAVTPSAAAPAGTRSRNLLIGVVWGGEVRPAMSLRPPRISYLVHEVLWDRRFDDVFTQTEDGRLAIDYRRLHDTRPIRSASA